MQTRQSKQIATAAAVLAGVFFVVIAVLYWTQAAGQLPSFLPGHTAGSLEHHSKHGILSLALGVCCFIAARFFWGPSQEQTN